MKQLRRSLTDEYISNASDIITKKILALPCYRSAKTIMAYMSAFREVKTDAIITDACINKRLVVPISDTTTFSIIPSVINDINDIVKGAYGIREPKEIQPISPNLIDIALIPGIAFDKSGNRLGFGKGYYDKFLAEFNGIKIGLCYDFQLHSTIPHDEHDVKMDMIITEVNSYDI